jgi:glycine/D-amino acid oxidase-like deaminating enzyme
MRQLLDSVDTDTDLPRRTGVIVIGAGIAGISTALALAEKGVAVTVLEKGRVGAEQSSRNWGWCRTMGRDIAEIPLAIESVRMWERMAERIGADVGFRRAGVAYVAENQRELDAHTAWLEEAKTYQVDSRLLDSTETAALLPTAAKRFPGCLYTQSDGKAEPQTAVPAMAAAVRRLGGVVLENCAARGLDIAAGQVAGVVTERGRIACDAVVLAGGAWSRLFCGNQGLNFPQLKVLGSVLRTTPMDGPDLTVGGTHWAFRKRADGGYTIARRSNMLTPIVPDSFRLLPQFAGSFLRNRRDLQLRVDGRFATEWRTPRRWSLDQATPFEATRVLDPVPVDSNLAYCQRELIQAFPSFASMKVAGSWGGLIDVTPDGVPVISAVDGIPGFHLASGFSGHGFGIGPGAGRLMADLVTHSAPIVDPTPFRWSRFTSSHRAAA